MNCKSTYSTKAELLKAVGDRESKFLIDYLDKGRYHRFIFSAKTDVLFKTAEKLSTCGHYYFNEMVVSGVRRKPYLDVETTYKTKDIFDQKYRTVVNGLVTDIVTVFEKTYGQRITGRDIKLLDSSGPAKGGWKISLHVIIAPTDRTLYYTDSRISTSSSYDFYKSLLPLNPIYNQLLDEQVYKADVNLRIIGSAKTHNDLRTLIPIDPLTLKPIVLTDKQKLEYMLTYVDPDRPTIKLETPIYDTKPEQSNPKSKSQFNKPLTTDCSIRLMELVKEYHKTAVYQGMSEDAGSGMVYHNFDYSDRNERCPISKRKHDSNRFFCFETERGLYLKCYSIHCEGNIHLGHLTETDQLVDTAIQINNQYLMNDLLMAGIIEDWANNKFILAIKSAMGTGKTHTLKYILTKFKYKKILWITHRQTLTKNITGSFKDYGFTSYLNDKSKLYYKERVIVQVDSLRHVTEYCLDDGSLCFNKYDLVIVDEVEGCLAHYNSPYLNNGEKSARNTFELMLRLMKNSSKVILLDADLGARTKLLIEELTAPQTDSCAGVQRVKSDAVIVYNSFMPMKKTFVFTNDTNAFDRKLLADIRLGKKICIISMCASALDCYESKIRDGGYTCVKHTAKTDDKLKDKLENVNEFWPQFQVVMYSPAIESGVDFNVDHFDRIYTIVADGKGTCSQRSFLQMVGRIRKINNYDIPCLYYTIPLTKTLKPILNAEVYTYDNMFEYIQSFETLNGRKILHDVTYSEVECDGYVKKVREHAEIKLFDKIGLHNEAEAFNKDSTIFITVLAKLIAKAGHRYRFDLIDPNTNNAKLIIEREPARDVMIGKLAAVDVTKYDIPDLLKRQAKSQLDETEKLVVSKYFFLKMIGVEPGANRISEYLELFWGKDVRIRRFELLFGYRELEDYDTDTIEVGKERSRLTIVLDLVNRLLGRPRTNRITQLKIRHVKSVTLTETQYKAVVNDIVTNSIYFRREDKYRPLFSRKRGKEKGKNEHLRSVKIIQSILDSYNIHLRQGLRIQVEGKRGYEHTLTVDRPMAKIIHAKHTKVEEPNQDIVVANV